ncbi:MAG: DJ-1/PfpI family protein [Spirochaetaceae bacterium]|nr:DJ-1/PfpI family protein [Spirochaetaceae bacterium]
MRIGVLYYEGFAEFEIALSLLMFMKEEVVFLALEDKEYRNEEQQRLLPDSTLDEERASDFDLLLIPGGDVTPLVGNARLKAFIGEALRLGKKVAGICGGSELLAAYGFLDGRECTGGTSGITEKNPFHEHYKKARLSPDSVVVDGNVITAVGQGYAELAVELGRQMGLVRTDEEYRAEMDWVKNRRGQPAI